MQNLAHLAALCKFILSIYAYKKSIWPISARCQSVENGNFTITMRKLKKKEKQYLELSILALISLFSILLWQSPVIYPIKLFVVLTHEICHGLAAVITGGKISAIQINDYLGGETFIEGGSGFIIANAGYLGSLVIGSLLFISSYKKKLAIWVCTILSVVLLIFTANFVYGGLGIALSMMYMFVLYLSPRYFKPVVNSYLLKVLGLVSMLYILIDIKEDTLTSKFIRSDAHLIGEITGTSPILWGLLWLVLSIVTIAFTARFAYQRGYGKFN